MGIDARNYSSITSVAEFAQKENLELLGWPLDINTLDTYDMGVLVSFGRLVPKKVIRKFPQFDTGPILKQISMPVPEKSSALELSEIMARKGADMLMETLAECPAHKVSASMSVVDWKQHTSDQVCRQYLALSHMRGWACFQSIVLKKTMSAADFHNGLRSSLQYEKLPLYT
nr:hypothetical protein BaRGS_020955 [Batillaria attramentaria]